MRTRPFARNLRIVAYADIHHGEYANGRTQSDMIQAEEWITRIAIDSKADWTVFAGDAFRSRNPHDECKTHWLEVRAKRLELFRELGINQLDIVGNHCRWYKAENSGHVYEALQTIYESSFDERYSGAAHISEVQENYLPNSDVMFYTLPAQVEFQEGRWDLDNNEADIKVCVVHGMVKGCLLNPNGHKADHGIPMEILDREQFDFVICGDIHIPQILDFKNTKGGYVGSTLQLDYTDMGEDRGALLIDFKKGEYEPVVQFIPFPHAELKVLEWSAKDPLPDLSPYEGSLLRVKVSNAGVMSSVDLDHVKSQIAKVARHVEWVPVSESAQKALINRSVIASAGPLDDFNRYMDSLGVQDAGTRVRRLEILGDLINDKPGDEPVRPVQNVRRLETITRNPVAANSR